MGHIRRYFVFDAKVVNEQRCKEKGIIAVREGIEEGLEIHKHSSRIDCPAAMQVVKTLNEQVSGKTCYSISREVINATN